LNVDIPEELKVRFSRAITNSDRFRGGMQAPF